ncbi:MAG: hypothetical protein K9M55_06825 [Candidatus Marinimicrobia bacterium]|nr:hypothetical protein [Candidatus Neomarinimicrobiota bacterium]MCF7922397.1 hypothetical protein [Candidatus Neomarinimicrobiota bacterium]
MQCLRDNIWLNRVVSFKNRHGRLWVLPLQALITLSSATVCLASAIDINGHFESSDKTVAVPEKWYTLTDSVAENHVHYTFLKNEGGSGDNAFFIENPAEAGSAALCLTKPISKKSDRDTYTLKGSISSKGTSGVIYINIYAIDRATRKKSWGHALIRDGGEHPWNQQSISFALPESAAGFGINLVLNGRGEVGFKNFTLERHSASGTPIPYIGHDQFLLVEPFNNQRPSKSSIFIHNNPDSVLYGSFKDRNNTKTLSKSFNLAPNEKAGFPIAIFHPEEASGVYTITSSADPSVIQVDQVHYWHQRRSDYTPTDAVIRAELIGVKPKDAYSLSSTRTIYWISIDGGAYAEPGVHKEQIVFSSGREKFIVDLELKMLPFDLETSSAQWALWVDSNRWKTWTDGEIFSEMKEIATTGFTSLVISDPGSSKNQDMPDNLKQGLDWLFVDRISTQYELAGFSQPLILSLQHLPARISSRTKTPPYTANDESIAILTDIFTEIKRRWPDIILYLDDELNNKSIEQQRFSKLAYSLAHKLKLNTFLTLTRLPTPQSDLPQADIMCFSAHSAAAFSQLLDRCERLGLPAQWYGSGTYDQQEGYLYPNRVVNGFMNWKLKGQFHGVWTFQRPDNKPYDDFDGSRKDWCLAYPNPKFNSSIYTIQWEAIRTGINDYRYLSTVESLIRIVLSDGIAENDQLARNAEAYLRQLRQDIPWFYSKNIGCATLNTWREGLVEHCLRLYEASQ